MGRAPAVLLLGGWEPSGRVGLLADWKTVTALGGRPMGVITSITAQGSSVFDSRPVPARLLDAQLKAILEREKIAAVKLGVIPNRRLLQTAMSLLPRSIPWVVDPVVKTSKEERLSTLQPRDYFKMAQSHIVLTPNQNEVRWLLARFDLATEEDFEQAARQLQRLGYRAVVVKGGHAQRGATDIVASNDKVVRLRSAKVTRDPEFHRGTGCRFASATAVALARGLSIRQAAKTAKSHVRRYLKLPSPARGEKVRMRVEDD